MLIEVYAFLVPGNLLMEIEFPGMVRLDWFMGVKTVDLKSSSIFLLLVRNLAYYKNAKRKILWDVLTTTLIA